MPSQVNSILYLHAFMHTIYSSQSHGQCSIRFNLMRVPLQAMHYAVDKVEVGTIFPATNPPVTQVDAPPSIKECMQLLEKLQQMSRVSPDQRNAIASMVDPAYTQVWIVVYTYNI